MKERKDETLYYSYIIEDVIKYLGRLINDSVDGGKKYLSNIVWLCSGFLPIFCFFEERKSFRYDEYHSLVCSYFEDGDIRNALLDNEGNNVSDVLYKRKRNKLYLKAFNIFNNELMKIADEYLDVIHDDFAFNRFKYPQSFLSYTYMDRGITLLIFFYFLFNGGYLYIDWMHSPAYPNGVVIKDSINDALESSNQLLFLYTPNSEFTSKGKKTLKAWCSWEFGSFYHRSHQSKFYLRIPNAYSSYGIPDILDTFLKLQYIDKGIMYGKERKLIHFYVPNGRDAEEVSLNLLIDYVNPSYSNFVLMDPYTTSGKYYRYDAYNKKTNTAIEFGMIKDISKEKVKDKYQIISKNIENDYPFDNINTRLNAYINRKLEQLNSYEVNMELVVLFPTRMSSSLSNDYKNDLMDLIYEHNYINIKKIYFIFIDCIYEFSFGKKAKFKEHLYFEKDE